MTERLYYSDSYLSEFRARIVSTDPAGLRVYLDRTAFYPTSGGQPFDIGTLNGVRVVDVADEDGRVVHVLAAPVAPEELEGREIEGRVDWARRFDHMQQHTGQHLLSAVFEELFAAPTLSFHMGVESSTIDIGVPSLDLDRAASVEDRCAEIVAQARPVAVTYEDAASVSGLRKESQRTGTLRIVSIADLDRSACGGTHVSSTAEIGAVLIRKLEKVRGNVRVEFVCGRRALLSARRDFRLLSEISRELSAPFERAPELIAAQTARLKSLEKSSQRLATELATREGRELHAATSPDADGLRRVTHRGPIDDAMRARAQAFTAAGSAVFLAICEDPPSLLLAASSDSGIHAGNRLKAALGAAGGRGGGNQTLAQGSVPSAEALSVVTGSLVLLR
ncbi:MAG TPA: alanyl-tRNA editing protein [Bryobacteraceae bacterium]|jgi:alanyl-tRNA synthetase